MNYFNPYMYQQPVQNQQIQNGGFLAVPNEDVVKSYPVGPGNCVTFKIEGKPIVMEKSMGFSQFESPKIDKYKLIKEEEEIEEESPAFDVQAEITALWSEIDRLKAKKPVAKKKAEVEDDPE